MKKSTVLLSFTFLFAMSGCTDDGQEATVPAPEYEKPRVTVILSDGGLGDLGYNDLIMEGIMRFYSKSDVSMSLISPSTDDDAQRSVSTWLNQTKGGEKSLLVLAEESYGELAKSIGDKLASNQHILVFEYNDENLPTGVTSFFIDRYGVAWLAGRMCGVHPTATVIAARPGASTLETAIEGFSDGYREGSGNPASVFYLADSDEGYNMADSAYKMTNRFTRTIILPLAGGSNNGIYKHTREVFNLNMALGMDVDCSQRCQNVPFSLVVKIDSLVEKHMTDWLTGSIPDGLIRYGLSDGVTDIVTAPRFTEMADILEDYILKDPQYWNHAYAAYKDEAIRKEQEHEEH